MLKAFSHHFYTDPTLIDVIFRTYRLWLRRPQHPDSPNLTSIAFDYLVCNREETSCSNRMSVPNFTRLTVRPLAGTLRNVAASAAGTSEETFKTLIARAKPHSDDDNDV